MLVVRFVQDWGLYAARDEAAFADPIAMGLQKHGLALVLGTVEEIAEPKAPAAVVGSDDVSLLAAMELEADSSKRASRSRA